MRFKGINTTNGITLVALIITIIVLLILAGVSISMVLGENGVLTQASKSKNETEIVSEKEVIELAYSALNSDVISGNSEKVLATDLENEIEKLYNKGDVTVTAGSTILIVKFELSQREYILDNKGNILNSMPMEEILATATKHPDQTLTEDIGVAEDGTQVNLDLWPSYRLDSDNTYSLGGGYDLGYNNDNIIDGKIQGKVPMYIKEDGGEFYQVSYVSFQDCIDLIEAPEIPSSVTIMNDTFSGCTNLIKVQKIPNGVTNIKGIFYKCTNLTEIPEIPNGVIVMDYAFYKCTSLEKIPRIPDSVKHMANAFEGCTSLVEAPEIPNSVISMRYTFCNCTNLTGTLKINANPTIYTKCLSNTSTSDGCNLVLVGNGENNEAITNIYNTKSDTSNITIGSET